MRAIVITLVVGACYSPTVPAGVPCGENNACPAGQRCVAGYCDGAEPMSDGNAGADVPDQLLIDAAPLCATWNARHFDPCMIPAPMGDLNLTQALSGYSWDTDTGTLKGKMNTTIPVTTVLLSQTDGPDVRLASVDNLAMEAGANLAITGGLPLLIAVWGSASIAGNIDADALFDVPGAGGAGPSNGTWCGSAPTGNSGSAGSPANGGGGGAFQGDGGRGGGASGGAGLALPAPTLIRGGCGGGNGGTGTGGAATRGAGGGAFQITARVAIDIASGSSLSAGGGAGRGGTVTLGGGGGGGAGGYIGLDAPTVTVAGTLAANGGGGGGGGSDIGTGSSGSNGATGATEANGGSGATATMIGTCSRGGNGSGGADLTGDNGASSACGGGGGGGGAGYILIWSPAKTITGTVSPPELAGP